jgi:hypothetical protein
MIVVKVVLEVPEYWIYYESFWWNDNWWETNKNFDLWDAYKWATTDAITKICSYMWIWIDVFKWKQKWDERKVFSTPEITKQHTITSSNQCPKCWTEMILWPKW